MILVTGNKNKVREFEEILKIQIDSKHLEVDEIQSVEVEDVVRHKAKEAYNLVKEPVLVEDTGLYFEELNGLPGAFIRFFMERLDLKQICNLVKNRNALAKTAIAYFDGKEMKVFLGEVRGKIAESPRGDDNFGWDPIFIPDGYDKTFAEMTAEEKHSCSMRKKAIEKFKEFYL